MSYSSEIRKFGYLEVNLENLEVTFRVNVDLGFAAKSGYQKVLTLTGTTRPEELSDWKYDENLKPDYVLDSIKDLEVITSRKLQDLLH